MDNIMAPPLQVQKMSVMRWGELVEAVIENLTPQLDLQELFLVTINKSYNTIH